jgi:hypothetical protein
LTDVVSSLGLVILGLALPPILIWLLNRELREKGRENYLRPYRRLRWAGISLMAIGVPLVFVQDFFGAALLGMGAIIVVAISAVLFRPCITS